MENICIANVICKSWKKCIAWLQNSILTCKQGYISNWKSSKVVFLILARLSGANHQKGQSKLERTNKETIILEIWLGLHTLYYLSHSRRLNLSRASWHDHQLQKQDVIILETCPLLSSDYTVDKSRTLFFYYSNFCNGKFSHLQESKIMTSPNLT